MNIKVHKGTINSSLYYKKDDNFELLGYCAAGYTDDHDTHWSTTGYIFTYLVWDQLPYHGAVKGNQ